MKEKWQKPQLVCLYRGKPEEKVLCGCKTYTANGPFTKQTKCENQNYCGVCHTGTAS